MYVLCKYVYVHTYVYTHVELHVYMYFYICICLFIFIDTQLYRHMCAYTCVCSHVKDISSRNLPNPYSSDKSNLLSLWSLRDYMAFKSSMVHIPYWDYSRISPNFRVHLVLKVHVAGSRHVYAHIISPRGQNYTDQTVVKTHGKTEITPSRKRLRVGVKGNRSKSRGPLLRNTLAYASTC